MSSCSQSELQLDSEDRKHIISHGKIEQIMTHHVNYSFYIENILILLGRQNFLWFTIITTLEVNHYFL